MLLHDFDVVFGEHAFFLTDIFHDLERLFVLEDVEAWCPSIRTATTIRAGQKREFVDPSIAIAALGLTPDYLKQDLKTFGFLFEALCERYLKIYAESFGAQVYHYQDYAGNEMDAVIEMPDGSWCGIEIKLGANKIEEAASNLIRIRNGISKDGGKAPTALVVFCGLSNAAYQRPDGVFVVPITALGA